ncbi:hypothetical protein AB0C51_03730 [Streptomyces pathocidini]|uniref:hypothetical protein n=1 Tax=Streptomyces pathocidini TaxID=1650571 RepID=UPI0033DC93B7
MSGNLINGGTAITCPHGGRVTAAAAPTGVRLDGRSVATGADVFAVGGCPHRVDGIPHPCTTVRWSPRPGGVLVDGAPVLLDTTPAQCFTAALVPQGPPRVTAVPRGVFCR